MKFPLLTFQNTDFSLSVFCPAFFALLVPFCTITAAVTQPPPHKAFCLTLQEQDVRRLCYLRLLPQITPRLLCSPFLTRGSCCVIRPMFCPFLPMMKRCSQAGAVTSTTITLLA